MSGTARQAYFVILRSLRQPKLGPRVPVNFVRKTDRRFTKKTAKIVNLTRNSLQRKERISRPERSALPG